MLKTWCRTGPFSDKNKDQLEHMYTPETPAVLKYTSSQSHENTEVSPKPDTDGVEIPVCKLYFTN
jgi:hypothetical protein